MLKKFATTALILSFSMLAQSAHKHAHAQEREYQSNINSIKLYNAPKIATPTQPEKPTVTPIAEQTRSGAPPKHDSQTKQTPTERVWSKYKELASGENNDAPPTDKPAIPVPEVQKLQPQAAEKAEPEAQKTGLQSLLQSYQMNKDQQRQMRTKTLRTPKAASTDAPSAQTPQ